MKRYLALITLSSIILGCQPPPNRPNVIRNSQNALPGEGGPDARNDPPIDSDIEGGKTPDSYNLLNCEEPETYRGIRGWRRLSNVEVKNTVVDTFGIKDLDYSEFAIDLTKKELFDTIQVESNFISSGRFNTYEKFSKAFAAKLDLTKFLPCANGGSTCLSQKLPAFLALAWRRPATEAEVKDLVALNDLLNKDGIIGEESIRLIVQSAILSHHFLYRSELGNMNDDGNFVLNDYELASALSYMIWRTSPDESLRNAASNGELSKDDGMRVWAKKMLEDPRAKNAFKDFARMWLESDKINRTEKADTSYTAAAKAKMIEEVGETFSHVMFEAPEQTYQALMTGNYTIAGAELAPFYNSAPANGKMPYRETDRLGLLGQVGFLSSHANSENPNPILRGVYITEHTLCMDFDIPPPFPPPTPQPGLSNKELFRQHNKPGCATCHTMIDNIGFAFENFDQLGRYRTVDAGQPIVVDSVLPLDGKDIPVNSPQEFFNTIANSNQGMQCFVREVFRYGLGRREYYPRPLIGDKNQPKLTAQGELDRCQIENATAKMKAAKGDLKTAIIEILASPGFKTRLIGKPE